jgi:dTDP-glucose 4,6-dehydratase
MSNWLIIGDSSFTGSALSDYLSAQGEKVTGASLRNGQALLALAQPWDYVVNFAAANVVAPSWDYPADYFNVNVMQQIPLWEAMRALPPKKYLHVSTPEVYGSTPFKVTEDWKHNPSTPYAASRSAAEQLLMCYFHQYGLPVVFSRSCNVYGPNQQLYRMVPKLLWSILAKQKFSLEGAGRSIRSFLHVRDACAALQLIATKGESGTAYHVSTSDTFWIRDFAQLVCKIAGADFGATADLNVPDRPGKDTAYSLDTTRIEQLGWQPTVDLNEGIRQTLYWMRANWTLLKFEPTTYTFQP